MDRAQRGAASERRWMSSALALLERWVAGPAVDSGNDALRAHAAACASAGLPRVLVVDDNPVNRLPMAQKRSRWPAGMSSISS
jgi:hypothetical protein